MKARFVAAALAAGLLACERAHAADILVTVTEQRVKGGPGCSLQEAMFSANFDENKSIVKIDSNSNPVFAATSCISGSGADRIILPFRAIFSLNKVLDDPFNPFGPGGTPMVVSDIVIEGNGSWVTSLGMTSLRAFAVGNTGRLTISNLLVYNFHVFGGNGANPSFVSVGGGGGGGLGAGAVAFVRRGTLIVRNSTFWQNIVLGGEGGRGNLGGGGGGLGGNGGSGSSSVRAGGGGGGSRGNGRDAQFEGVGGDGGGTVVGRLRCGGVGGRASQPEYNPLQNGQCDGGGGGGGGDSRDGMFFSQPGHGWYGGGGGGAGRGDHGDGGQGGFGGGGGASHAGSDSPNRGGDGGFGGGGGASYAARPGGGGMFGGDGFGEYSGGGAGLGGAIFSDGGTILIENSTLTSNAAYRGLSGGDSNNAEGRGGAVFSFGGRLTLRNVTIAGNHATTADSGVVMYKQVELPGDDHELTTVAELDIQNSIIANNSLYTVTDASQCRAVGLVPTGVGNLIHNETNCAGVVRTGDPLLGPLSNNAPGDTLTMAITSNASEAFNTADPATSLPLDQRGMPRPKQGGFDIGAYERCVARPETGIACVRPPLEVPQMALLTTLAAPPFGGSVSPATGLVPLGSVQPLVAAPAAGWMFTGWTGDAVGSPASASTFVGMDAAHLVIANFVTWTPRPAGRATPGSSTAVPRVDLTWLGTSGVDHYEVSRAGVSGGPYAVVGSATSTSFRDRTAGLTNGGTYFYIIQAVAADGTVFGKSSEAVVKIPAGR